MDGTDKIKLTVSESRIKLHVFEPSQRTIYSIVGKSKEYWVDPDGEYCSCNGYHYTPQDGKKTCYHLDAVRLAASQNKIEVVRFSDSEFSEFIDGLISDL